MTPLKNGIAIDGIEKNNVSLSQLRNKSHLKMTLKKTFSQQLHSRIIIYYITRCLLFRQTHVTTSKSYIPMI